MVKNGPAAETEMGRPRNQKRAIKQLHADLVSLGYDGSYGRVAAFTELGATITGKRNR